MADSANAAGWRVTAGTICGTARDNVIGAAMRWSCSYIESYTGARVTPARVLNSVIISGEITAHKFVTPITPGTAGTSSFAVTEFDSSTSQTVSCANTRASSGAIEASSPPFGQRQEFEYNPGDTETLMPISVA